MRKHKSEPEVVEVLKKSTVQQNIFFDRKRKDGIYEYNVLLISDNRDPLMRERQLHAKVLCPVGFFTSINVLSLSLIQSNPDYYRKQKPEWMMINSSGKY